MKKIIVDTNIIFSCLLNSQGTIGDLIFNIDIDDTDFVALTRYLKGCLWTGDKPLYEGLKAKRFRTIYNTQDMIKLRDRLTRL